MIFVPTLLQKWNLSKKKGNKGVKWQSSFWESLPHQIFTIFLVFRGLLWLLPLLIACSESSEWDQRWNLVQDAMQKKDYTTARKSLQALLPEVRESGASDIRYAQVVFQLAEVARLEGQTEKAESLYWETLPLFAQSMGPEHLKMSDPLQALANLYQEKDQPRLALPLQKRALTLQEKALGRSDARLLPTLQRYHDLLRLLDQDSKAEEVNSRIRHLLTLPP